MDKRRTYPGNFSDSLSAFPMTPEERLVADFRGTGTHRRPSSHGLPSRHTEAPRRPLRHGTPRIFPTAPSVRIAGTVIARQRPGTAKGFVFLSIEDETGIANAIITPQLFTQNRIAVVVHQQFRLIEVY